MNIQKAIILWVAGSLLLASCTASRHQARFIILPDTQTYAEKYPAVLDSQISYILREKKDIDLVLQLGDLTQNNNEKEWQVIQHAFSRLDHQLPYVLALGNHDMGSTAGKFADVRDTRLFNQFFPLNHMTGLPAFGNVFEDGRMDNAYYLLQTGRIKWLVFSLEFGARNSVLAWAQKVIDLHPDHTIIINTHSYMYSDSTRQGPGDKWRPQAYGVGKDSGDSSVNDGEQIWNKLVKHNPNIRFVFSGHVLNSGVGTLVSINTAGYPVYQMLANYQEGVENSVMGGNGWLRILDLDFRKRTVKVSTYSPYIKTYKEDPAHSFIIRNVIFNSKSDD